MTARLAALARSPHRCEETLRILDACSAEWRCFILAKQPFSRRPAAEPGPAPCVGVASASALAKYMDEFDNRTYPIGEDQVLEAARRHHGLERMEEIKYAILEANGEISIIPYPARHAALQVQAL